MLYNYYHHAVITSCITIIFLQLYWIERWMDGWIDRGMDAWIFGWKDSKRDGRIDE